MNRDEAYKVYSGWIDRCKASDKLTEWEVEFVASIEDFLKTRGYLSHKQADILERIYAQRTD